MGKKRRLQQQDQAGSGSPTASTGGDAKSVILSTDNVAVKKKPKLSSPLKQEEKSVVSKAGADQRKVPGEGKEGCPKKRKKNKKRKHRGAGDGGAGVQAAEQQSGKHAATSPDTMSGGGGGGGGGGLSTLQAKFKQKLEGAQFRMLNEMLYTTTGSDALSSFKTDPQLFDVYHKGYREQVSKWPRNPLDDIINWVRNRGAKARIADLGCGEGRLAASVPNQVHSFDLVAKNPRVVACDISKVPLSPASVDVVVFCLSLMGTNMMDFIKEAKRILVDGGVIKIAEVRSRFEGQEGGIEEFKKACEALGLRCKQLDKGNKMFFLMEFVKEKEPAGGDRGGDGDDDDDDAGEQDVPQQQQKKKPQSSKGVKKHQKHQNGGKGKGKEGAATSPFSAKACVYKRR